MKGGVYMNDKDMKLLKELNAKMEFDANSLDDIEFGWCSNCTRKNGNNSGHGC